MPRGKSDGEPRVAKNISLPEPLATWLRRQAAEEARDQADLVKEALEALKLSRERNAAGYVGHKPGITL